jgi:predicted RND superfamily exporter protein
VAFCVLLVGLGIDFAFHIASHYWLNLAANETFARRDRLVYALAKPGRGLFVGGLSTMMAFVTLSSSSYPAIRQTGLLIALGVALLLCASFSFLPAALYVWPTRQASMAQRTASLWSRTMQALYRSTVGTRTTGLALWAVLALLATGGVLQIRFEGNPFAVLMQGNPIVTRLEALNHDVGMSLSAVVVVSSGASPQSALDSDRQVMHYLFSHMKQARIAMIDSLAMYIPSAQTQEAARHFLARHQDVLDPETFTRTFRQAVEEQGLGTDPYLVDEYLRRVVQMLQVDPSEITPATLGQAGLSEKVARHLRRVGDVWYVASYVYPVTFPWIHGALEPLLAVWEGRPHASGPPALLLAGSLRTGSQQRIIQHDAIRIITLGILAVGGLLWLNFRSCQALIYTLLPLGISLWLLVGFMGYCGIPLNFITLAVLPILLGIGVDDGVHIIERWRRGEALPAIYVEAGPGLVMTSLTTAGAFVSLLTARNAAIHDFGLCGAVGIMLCLTAALHLLPLLVQPHER